MVENEMRKATGIVLTRNFDSGDLRISVVTPSLNMAPYIEGTIKSVIGNLKEGDEYFVIDGGSTDGSTDIIRRYEDHITGWVSENDAGYADALAKGFARASGDILCWINAGDIYLAGALDAARKLMTDDLDMIFGDDFYIDEANTILAYSRGWVPNLRMAMLYGGWTPLQDACFWRCSLYRKIGGLDRSLRYAADYDLFLRMALAGRTGYVPLTFSAFRRHTGQKSFWCRTIALLSSASRILARPTAGSCYRIEIGAGSYSTEVRPISRPSNQSGFSGCMI